ncbi:hypothetical protein HN51_061251 [Arachis hypogaea]|nr:uncharacterized protein LOC107644023 [Arachis ipaensis]XP_025626438.1 uncharacterized protein LOC112719916 [Arachis hypogaea]QHO18449.1 uncharacterized protein DS421_11g320630 [Arachis hypogaea]RYR27650.1 hypothetical protein Ahy_B01g051671 isoform B [Arachis hypogaea]
MAYVPPHMRHSKDNQRPSPSPELPPRRRQFSHSPKLNLSSIYSKDALSNWFVVSSHDHDHDDNQLHPSLQLRPVSLESFDCNFKQKPLILVQSTQHQSQSYTIGTHATRNPWEIVAAKAIDYLLSSFENVRTEMKAQNPQSEQIKPYLVARFGKILFHGTFTQEERPTMRQFRRSFYTSVPASYMEKMTTSLPLELGLEPDNTEKDMYLVKLSDANRPEATISCKCSIIKEQNKLKLYKVELNYVRHMVTDVSCPAKNLDLRLMLCTKRIIAAPKDDEIQCIQKLIDSAVLDENVKGGLRWPLGKASSGDRFSVIGVWHTITKAYVGPSLRLKARHADRFDFLTSTGESASEVSLKLKGIVSALQVQKVDTALISKMLEDTIKLLWDQFLNCDDFLG